MELFLLENGKYIFFGILGLGFLIAGIITGKKNKGVKKNKVYNAEILACDIVEYYLAGMPVQGFEITFGIQTNQGTITKRLTRRDPLDVGETIEVYYDSAKGIVKPVDEVETVESAYPTALCVLGVIFLLVMCALAIVLNVNMGEEVFPYVFGFAACGLFLYIGLYLAILRPHKLNKELINCELVEGEITDVIKTGYGNFDSDSRSDNRSMYSCVYGYQYGGKQRTLKSSKSSNTYGPSMIGRKVTIVINHKSGSIYCAEDEKNLGMGIVFMLFGLIGLAVLTYIVF